MTIETGSASLEISEIEEGGLTVENLESAATEILASTEREAWLKLKFQDKLDAKDTAMAGDDGTNDFADWKCLGELFLLNEGSLSKEASEILRSNGIDVYHDEVAELHIPTNTLSSAKLRGSVDRLTEYVNSDERNSGRPPLEFVYGATYLPADKFGFKKVQIPEIAQSFSAAKRVLERMRKNTDSQVLQIEKEVTQHKENPRAKALALTEQQDAQLKELTKRQLQLKARQKKLQKYSEKDIALYYMPVESLKTNV